LPFAFCLLLCLLLSCAGCGQKLSDKIYWKGEEAGALTEEERAMPVVYLALGDSTGVGVGARKGGGGYVARVFERIERVRPGSRLVNLCVSGATTSDVLRSQVGRVGAASPTLVTLGIGINDVSRQVSVEQFARNYEEIILRIKKETDAPIVLTNIPDISNAPAVPVFLRAEALRRINLYNQSIREIAARHNLLVVDAYEKSHAVIPTHPEFFSSDGFHPSDEGYEFWAVTIWPTVKQAIGEE
jgi:lysophospholipase L1-like esterase